MVTDNDIIVTNGAGDAYGIELNATAGNIDAAISDTDITVTSTGRSRGVFGITPGYLTTSLTDVNIDARGRIADGVDFTAGTGVDLAVSGGEIIASGAFSGVNGLRLNSSGSMNLTVDDTDMTVSTTGGEAYGINGIASGDVNASITGGSIDASGVFGTGGWLEATGPGSRLNLHISGSDIRATGTVGETHGLYFHGGLVDAAIADTDLTVSNTDNTDAVGILGVATDHLNASVSGTTVNVTGHGARGDLFRRVRDRCGRGHHGHRHHRDGYGGGGVRDRPLCLNGVPRCDGYAHGHDGLCHRRRRVRHRPYRNGRGHRR